MVCFSVTKVTFNVCPKSSTTSRLERFVTRYKYGGVAIFFHAFCNLCINCYGRPAGGRPARGQGFRSHNYAWITASHSRPTNVGRRARINTARPDTYRLYHAHTANCPNMHLVSKWLLYLADHPATSNW